MAEEPSRGTSILRVYQYIKNKETRPRNTIHKYFQLKEPVGIYSSVIWQVDVSIVRFSPFSYCDIRKSSK